MRGPSADSQACFTSLPLVILQTGSRLSPLLLGLVIAPLFIALATPFALLGIAVVTNPAVRMALIERPLTGAQLLLASAALVIIFGWPLLRFARSAGRGRTIHIERGCVTVTERGVLGTRTWAEPLSHFTGIAHRVGSSLSGVRHELRLVHPDHRRTLVIWAAPRISEDEVSRTAALLDLAEISSIEATSHEPLTRRLGPSHPQPRLTVATLAVAET